MPKWKVLSTFATFTTPWVTFIGEHVLDEQEKRLDYWRVEKDDSVIVIPIQKDTLIIPKPFYRHGIQKEDLDFPGGRRPKDQSLYRTACSILERELSVKEEAIISLSPINQDGWPINSSFSNQYLFGFKAWLEESFLFDPSLEVEKVELRPKTLSSFLERLNCLQCRALFLEFLIKHYEVLQGLSVDKSKNY